MMELYLKLLRLQISRLEFAMVVILLTLILHVSTGVGQKKWMIKKDVVYKLVEQCKTKDMEQKTEIFVSGIDEHAIKINENTDEQLYGSLLDKLFTTYKAKNHDYSGAFTEMFDELGIDYAYGKLREKINRIKVLRKQPNMVENEGLKDALIDTAGYAILTLVELKKRKQ